MKERKSVLEASLDVAVSSISPLPSTVKAGSGPLIPALATTISTHFLGELAIALRNMASWSSQEVTSHVMNFALLTRRLVTKFALRESTVLEG